MARGGGLEPAGPSPEKVGRFRLAFEAEFHAGTMMTASDAQRLGTAQGLSLSETWRAVSLLSDEGGLVAYSNAANMRVHWETERLGPDAQAALDLARRAVTLANAEGRGILDELRDRGGVVRLSPVFVGMESEGVGAHYFSLFDHVMAPLQTVQGKGWTLEEFLADPAKQRQLAKEMGPTLAHELKHAAQYRRSPFFPGVFRSSIEFEYEAYLAGHMFVHAALQADPKADLASWHVSDYESFLGDFDGYLKGVKDNKIYAGDAVLNAPYYNDFLARQRAGWPRHAAEGYRLLAQRFPERAEYYLGKAAQAK